MSDRERVEAEIQKLAGGLCCGHDFMYEPILAALRHQRAEGMMAVAKLIEDHVYQDCLSVHDTVEKIRAAADELEKGE